MNQAPLRKSDRIYIAGHRGLVGSAIVRNLQARGYADILTASRDQLNLEDQTAVRQFFAAQKPDVVFVAAAKVGGIDANARQRADFISQNLRIQENVIWSAHLHNVRRLIFLGSSCVYPRETQQPMKENCLLSSPLEFSNRPYAIAKIAGLETIDALRRQFDHDYFSVMPTNLYGPGDNFHPTNSHVVPALIHRFIEAVNANSKTVMVWGSGKPKRELMHVDDCADAIVYLAENLTFAQLQASAIVESGWSHVNVGSQMEVSIRELAEIIADLTHYSGTIQFDPSKPDGTPRKLLDSSFLKSLGWSPKTRLKDGLKQTIDWYLQHSQQVRNQ